MTQENSKNNGLIFAIIFAAAAISGSLVFLGIQLAGGGGSLDADDLKTEITKGINAYVEDQQEVAAKAQAEANKPKKVDGDFTDDDAVLGDEDAPVTIVEFSDYQCPYCGKFFRETLPAIKEKYIDTGKVKLVYRDLPLSFHQDAYPMAHLAECVRDQKGDDAYFKIHDKIFELMGQSGIDSEAMLAYAAELGVDTDELTECTESDKFKQEIEGDIADANKVGINGTPGFIVNNNVISGAQPFAAFESIIEAELAK